MKKIFKLEELDEAKDYKIIANCIKNYGIYGGYGQGYLTFRQLAMYTSQSGIYFDNDGNIYKTIK